MTRRLTAFILLTAAFALTTPVSAAIAHDAVIATSPGEGETVTAVPEAFSVTANAPLLDTGGDATGFGLVVTDATGLYFGDGCLSIDGPTLSMPATLGEPGNYSLTYQYISSDGHTSSGAIAFVFAPDEDSAAVAGRAEPPVCGQAAPEPDAAPSTSGPEPGTAESTASTPPAAAVDESSIVLAIAAGIGGAVVLLAVIIALVARRGGRPAA